MVTNKKDYQSVLSALVDHGTLPNIVNKLNKVSITTEDTDLKKLIEPVVANVEDALRNLPTNRKSVKGSLRRSLKAEPYKVLVDYCQRCISSTKPQWQIIAERHGWSPKT